MNKRITVSIIVADPYHSRKLRALKNNMIGAVMERVRVEDMDVFEIKATVGNVRKP